jgi:hypothetical protein
MIRKKYGLGLAIAASCMAFGTASASAAKVQVLPSDINATGGEWSLTLTGTGTGAFQTGPRVPPLGSGSFKFTTSDNSAKVELFTNRYKGTLLSDVNAIGYSTFRDPDATDPSKIIVPSLQLPIDRNGNVDTGGAFTTLVYEPYLAAGNLGIDTGSWQDWDATVPGNAAGGWYATGAGGTASGCTPAATCTLAQLKTAFPSAKLYAAGLDQGSGNQGGKADADALYLGVAGQGQTTFDFEAEPGPTGPQGNQGPQGAQGPQGTSGAQGTAGLTPSSVTTTAKVSLVSKSLKVSKRTRKATITVSCPRANGLCEGRLNLIKKGKTIGRTAFVVRGGRSSNVGVNLSKKAYKGLKKSQQVRIDVFSRDLAGNASSASKSLTLKK